MRFGFGLTGFVVATCCVSAAFAGSGTPPTVAVTAPNAGETLTSGTDVTISWTASDSSGLIVNTDVFISYDNGATWLPLALGLFEVESLNWSVVNRPTNQGFVRVVVMDPFSNVAQDENDVPFTIVSGPVGAVPTTLRDFDLPGTQPLQQTFNPASEFTENLGELNSPSSCSGCHGFFSETAMYERWQGSMMAHASIDPIFHAALEVANQDAPESGDLCLRCHVAAGWLMGRSSPTDGSRILHEDMHGVSCDLCHRMVDPIYEVGVNPVEDEYILDALAEIPVDRGEGMYIVDPSNFRRRGPFDDALVFHDILVSPYHREAALCGTCHDVSNPVLDKQPDGTYLPNAWDTPPTSLAPGDIMPEQRTYSEWFHSAFNSVQGVFRPEFGGNLQYVSSCQDCHMRDFTGRGCFSMEAPLREDQPLHDFSGANTWVLSIIDQLDPSVSSDIIADGVARARYMLQNAADLDLDRDGDNLLVKITNRTGHKLPTGYPEGRRMWINVAFYDAADMLVSESGHYDSKTAELLDDPQLKVYEARLEIDENIAGAVGFPAGTEFHLVLNNHVHKDNRIPPEGFTNAAFESVAAQPVGAVYADGQHWDTTSYTIPKGADRVEVRVYYQTTTREYIEFLRDTATGGAGQAIYDLWNNNGQAPPELMNEAMLNLSTLIGDMNCDGQISVGDINPFVLALTDPSGYAAMFPDCDILNGDCSGDQQVTVGDINCFVALVVGG